MFLKATPLLSNFNKLQLTVVAFSTHERKCVSREPNSDDCLVILLVVFWSIFVGLYCVESGGIIICGETIIMIIVDILVQIIDGVRRNTSY